jgi:regulator of protease activity HflC (stomatin/prohibitin superfamily)
MNKKLKYENLTQEQINNMSSSELRELKEEYQVRKTIKIGIISFTILFAIITFFNSITTVPTGHAGIKTRFGKVQNEVITEGLNVKVPFIEKIVKIDCRTQKIEVANATATKDLQEVTFTIAVNYNITKETANEMYKTTGTDFQNVILNPSILESIKAVTAQYKAEELITKRGEVSNKMQETLKEKIEAKGFNVIDFNIIDLDFSAEYNQAIEKKQVAEQQAQQAQYELEKARVENEKKIENAKADAEVMRQQNSQITNETLRLKELENQKALIDKWNGALPTTALGDNIPMLNINQ